MSKSKKLSLLKMLPGLAISAFFLWRTFRGISANHIRSLRIVSPIWILALVAFSIASYTLRTLRWKRMMRSVGTSFATCGRVLMTSLAANNILPLRIGDIMRIFTYAPDLGATPTFVLSTLILEKLLDIFALGLFFALTLAPGVPTSLRTGAHIAVIASGLCLAVLIFGARALQAPLTALFKRLPHHRITDKLEHWILLALECIRNIGIVGTCLLFAETLAIWTVEALIFLSAARILGLISDPLGPWNAVAAVNLSFLIPSSPGGIGPFEAAAQKSFVSHGADPAQSALFGLALHVWMLVTITSVGGALFLIHRYHRATRRRLLEEIETLPAELP